MQDPIVLLLHKLLDAETFVEAREAGAELQTAIHDHIDRLRAKLVSLEPDLAVGPKTYKKMKKKSRN